MNVSSRICDYVIADFVRTDTPILTVHDSFILPIGHEDRLKQLMKEAFEDVTHKAGIKATYNQNLTKKQLSVHDAQDRDWYFRVFNWITKSNPTNGYRRRLDRHREYFGNDYGNYHGFICWRISSGCNAFFSSIAFSNLTAFAKLNFQSNSLAVKNINDFIDFTVPVTTTLIWHHFQCLT